MHPAPRRSTRKGVSAVVVIASAAGVFGVRANEAPSGSEAADVIWVLAFVIACIAASVRGSDRSRVWFGTVALIFSGLQPWTVCGAAAFVGALWLGRRKAGDDSRVSSDSSIAAAAAVAAAGALACLHFPELPFTGGSALAAASAAIPLWLSAVRRLRHRSMQWVRRAAVAAACVTVLSVAVFGIAAMAAGRSIERAAAAATDAQQAVTDGDSDRALAHLNDINNALQTARSRVDRWYTQPAAVVPIVGHYRTASVAAVRSASELGTVLNQLALDTDLGSTLVRGGTVQLSELDAIGNRFDEIQQALEQAADRAQATRSVWLIPAVERQSERAEVELAAATESLSTGEAMLEAAPRILGQQEAFRWLVVFMTPAEARELGGLIANWAVLETESGAVRLVDSGRIIDLAGNATVAGVADPSTYPEEFLTYRLDRYFQNLSGTPDFPTAARAMAEIFPQRGGSEVDGVIAVDPFALGALTAATGPLEVRGVDEPMSGDELVDFLLRGQYEAFETLGEREDMLDAITTAMFDKLEDPSFNPVTVLRDLQPMVEQGRIRVTTFDPGVNAALDQIDIRGTFDEIRDGSDGLALFTDAAVPRKLDIWLDRSVTYDVQLGTDGNTTSARARVSITNRAPQGLNEYVAGEVGDFLFEDGTPLPVDDAFSRLSLYSVGEVTAVSIDGTPAEYRSVEEYNRNRALVFVHVPRGETVEVEYQLSFDGAPVDTDPYRLAVGHQPVVNPTEWTVNVSDRPADQFILRGDRQLVVELPD